MDLYQQRPGVGRQRERRSGRGLRVQDGQPRGRVQVQRRPDGILQQRVEVRGDQHRRQPGGDQSSEHVLARVRAPPGQPVGDEPGPRVPVAVHLLEDRRVEARCPPAAAGRPGRRRTRGPAAASAASRIRSPRRIPLSLQYSTASSSSMSCPAVGTPASALAPAPSSHAVCGVRRAKPRANTRTGTGSGAAVAATLEAGCTTGSFWQQAEGEKQQLTPGVRVNPSGPGAEVRRPHARRSLQPAADECLPGR